MKRLTIMSDPILLGLALLATFMGLFLIFDAGYARSILQNAGLLPREFRTQCLFVGIAASAGLIASTIRPDRIKRWTPTIAILAFVAVVLVEIPHVGITKNGATRWIGVEPIQIQPAEFAKLAAVLFLAWVFAFRPRFKPRAQRSVPMWLDNVLIPRLKRSWPFWLVLATAYLIEREPDLGTAAVLVAILLGMMWYAGVSRLSLGLAVAFLALGVGIVTVKQPYRMERILAHGQRWDPKHVDDIGYQTTQSEMALASGGLTGVGIGSGRAKHMMPAATTDFILATVGEEFGLVGSLMLPLVLGLLTFRLLLLSRMATNLQAKYYFGGCAIWIGVQTCVNIMMANGTLPPIGIPLPFISSGGSSLVALWLMIGLGQSFAASIMEKEVAGVATGRDRWRDRRTRFSRA